MTPQAAKADTSCNGYYGTQLYVYAEQWGTGTCSFTQLSHYGTWVHLTREFLPSPINRYGGQIVLFENDTIFGSLYLRHPSSITCNSGPCDVHDLSGRLFPICELDGVCNYTAVFEDTFANTLPTYTLNFQLNDSSKTISATASGGDFSKPRRPAEIAIRSISNLTSGLGEHSLGSVRVGTTQPNQRDFTITNVLGHEPLLLNGNPRVQITGANAADFSVISDPPASIGGGGFENNTASASMTIGFTPTAMGTRRATITIPNNDSDEGNYVINVIGTGLDGIPPVITAPANIITTTDAGLATAVVDFAFTASDNIDGDISTDIVLSHASGSAFPVGTTTVTADVVDSSGNPAEQKNFTITVADNQPPVITPPANQNIGTDDGLATASLDVTTLGTTVNDNVDMGIIPMFRIGSNVLTGPYDFPIGTTIVTIDATDMAGLTATQQQFNVTVMDDEAPIVTNIPSDQNLQTDYAKATSSFDVTTLGVSVSDNNDIGLSPVFKLGTTQITGPYDFPLGVSIVTIDATDTAGNDAIQAQFQITVADNTFAAVTFTDVPDGYSGSALLNITINFSEPVSGFNAGEILIQNGTVEALIGGGVSYIASLRGAGTGDIILSVPENVAQEVTGNGNLASEEIQIADTTIEDTQRRIATFQQTRATHLIGQQVNLIRLLSGKNSGSANAQVTRGAGDFSLSVTQENNIWYSLNGTWSKNDTYDNRYVSGSFGIHKSLSEKALIGVMLQVDHLRQSDTSTVTEGNGWLVGPYFAAELDSTPLSFEGRILYGQGQDRTRYVNSGWSDFDSERWLLQFKTQGEFSLGKTILYPNIDLSYTSEEHDTFTDIFGNTITSQNYEILELSLGSDFIIPMNIERGQLDLIGGISGILSETNGNSIDLISTHDTRIKASFGFEYIAPQGWDLKIKTSVDGIGARSYKAYGVNLVFGMKF